MTDVGNHRGGQVSPEDAVRAMRHGLPLQDALEGAAFRQSARDPSAREESFDEESQQQASVRARDQASVNQDEPTTDYAPMKDNVNNRTTPVVEGYLVMPSVLTAVEVTAPADMIEGYEFSVDVQGKHVVVQVPKGGVKQGQVFQAPVVNEKPGAFDSHNIPVGHWRDGRFSCFNHGCCHPHFCLSLWMTPVALGQIMTRMNLDWEGTPIRSQRQEMWSAFKVMIIVFVLYQAIDNFVYYLTYDYIQGEYSAETGKWIYPEVVPFWATFLDSARRFLSICYGGYVLIAMIRTRYYIRSKYAIPEEYCHGCEDCCCSFWCGFCSLCQMARHTADYERFPGVCCTDTGLDYTAPPVV